MSDGEVGRGEGGRETRRLDGDWSGVKHTRKTCSWYDM